MAESSGNTTQNRPLRLVLVGFMGAGKTTVGKELARLLQWEFVDLDDRIEVLEQRSVREIFAREGEPYFRIVEREELGRVLEKSERDIVVSVGGGAFAQPEAAELIERHAAVSVLLDAPVEELRRRVAMGANVRPLANDEERFARLYRDRSAAYSKAHQRFDTGGKSVAKVAREIAEWVGNKLKK